MGGPGNSRAALEANNGCVRSGRPRKYPEGIRREQQRAREAGAAFLPSLAAFWMRSVRDKDLDWRRRNRAAENLADRCGWPRKAQFDGAGASMPFTLEGMRETLKEIVREILLDPKRGIVQAVDAEFISIHEHEIKPGGNGSAGSIQ